jgi:hypothetical protein
MDIVSHATALAIHVISSNGKVTQGSLLVLHALIYVSEAQFEQFIPSVQNYLTAALLNSEDASSGRLACGLVSDLSNYLERGMVRYADPFMDCLSRVLQENRFTTETKLTAMIAVGDCCLAIEQDFLKHLDKTMNCLFSAVNITL